MTRVLITATAVPAATYNLTDSTDFETLVTGAGNGVEFTHNPAHLLILKNASGLSADFTIKVPTPSTYTDITTVNDDVITVADGKTYLVKLASVYKQTNGLVYVDCDQACDVLLVSH
jgi:hypothetical protein